MIDTTGEGRDTAAATSESPAPEDNHKAPVTAETMPSSGTVLTSDFQQLQQMYQAQNMTRGIAPLPV